MFFLTRNDIKATDVFPKDLPTKICADFTCKGRDAPETPAHTATLGMLANYPKTPLPQSLVTFPSKKLAGSMSGTS